MMKLVFNEQKTDSISGGIFTGEVELQRIVHKAMGANGLSVTTVNFPPGVRNMFTPIIMSNVSGF